MAEMRLEGTAFPSRTEIEAAVFLHRERTDLGVAHTTPEEATLAQVAEAWLAAMDGPTIKMIRDPEHGHVTVPQPTGYSVVELPPGTYVLIQKGD